jgi:hypothetical protein
MNTKTLNYIHHVSINLFGKTDHRIDKLYKSLIDICENGNVKYYKLETQYHDLDHFLASAEVCIDIYSHGVQNNIINKNYNEFFCAVVAALYHDIGFVKNKDFDPVEGTGAQFINVHVSRGCSFMHENFEDILTKKERHRICSLIAVTDYFKKGENSMMSVDYTGSCVALGDWLSQMGDEQYVEKLGNLYEEFNEFQIKHQLVMYTSFEDLIHKTPNFWNNLVKPLLDNKFYALYQHSPKNYIEKIEQNIKKLVDQYQVTI